MVWWHHFSLFKTLKSACGTVRMLEWQLHCALHHQPNQAEVTSPDQVSHWGLNPVHNPGHADIGGLLSKPWVETAYWTEERKHAQCGGNTAEIVAQCFPSSKGTQTFKKLLESFYRYFNISHLLVFFFLISAVIQHLQHFHFAFGQEIPLIKTDYCCSLCLQGDMSCIYSL